MTFMIKIVLREILCNLATFKKQLAISPISFRICKILNCEFLNKLSYKYTDSAKLWKYAITCQLKIVFYKWEIMQYISAEKFIYSFKIWYNIFLLHVVRLDAYFVKDWLKTACSKTKTWEKKMIFLEEMLK